MPLPAPGSHLEIYFTPKFMESLLGFTVKRMIMDKVFHITNN